MPRITHYETVQRMADSLMDKARLEDIDISGVKPDDSFNTYLDDAFNDRGCTRCEYFADLSWPYATQFGVLESKRFETAQWSCIIAAIREIRRRLKLSGGNS